MSTNVTMDDILPPIDTDNNEAQSSAWEIPDDLKNVWQLTSPIDSESYIQHIIQGTDTSQPHNEVLFFPTIMMDIIKDSAYANACELSIHPIAYVDGELIYSKASMKASLEACRGKRFQFARLLLNDRSGTLMHANLLLMEKNIAQNKWIIERFDPHGNKQMFSEDVDVQLQQAFRELMAPEQIEIISPSQLCPFSGPQVVQEASYGMRGYCQTWVLYYLHMRLKNPEVSSLLLLTNLRKASPATLTRNITKFVYYIREKSQPYPVNVNYGDIYPAITKTIFLLHWLVIVFPNDREIVRHCINVFREETILSTALVMTQVCDDWTAKLPLMLVQNLTTNQIIASLATELATTSVLPPQMHQLQQHPLPDTTRTVAFNTYYDTLVQTNQILENISSMFPSLPF